MTGPDARKAGADGESLARIAALRRLMASEGLSAFLVPRCDEHRGETVPGSAERLAWLTGFTGSNGFCVATADRAGLFVDSRYRLQARIETDPAIFEQLSLGQGSVSAWIRDAVPDETVLGYDPRLHTKSEIDRLSGDLEDSGIRLHSTDNLVDQIWTGRPALPRAPVFRLPVRHAGEDSMSKRRRMAETMAEAGANAAVLTLPDSIAWLLNIRGSDLPCTPVPLAFAILESGGAVRLFLELPREHPDAMEPGLEIIHRDRFADALAGLTGVVMADPDTAPILVFGQLDRPDCRIVEHPDPCIHAKAIKNSVEIAGMIEAHKRDGAAMIEFLSWLEVSGTGAGLTERDVSDAVNSFRRETGKLLDISFDTIAASGAHGAIIHYRVTPGSNRSLNDGELLLVDSGGQYLDGTTDVTRTIPIGHPSEWYRECFTRVLKGLICLSRARWPAGRAGRDLDALARYSLWQAGLDYAHGTGHGVGHCLKVHEGPQGLSPNSNTPLEAGMILSIEPGCYLEDDFGIRIENLVRVIEWQPECSPGSKSMLEFSTLTSVPIDRRLIDRGLLTDGEINWIDDYHRRVVVEIGGRCSPAARQWLAGACAPLRQEMPEQDQPG